MWGDISSEAESNCQHGDFQSVSLQTELSYSDAIIDLKGVICYIQI